MTDSATTDGIDTEPTDAERTIHPTMTEELQAALEQNRSNLKTLLSHLEADYEMDDDSDQKAKLASAMGLATSADKDTAMDEQERIAWLLWQNSKAIAAAAEAAGARDVKTDHVAGDGGRLGQVADALGGGR